MTDLERVVICFINEFHRRHIYRYEDYQMLHNVKYEKGMPEEHRKLIRDNYRGNCFEAAYQLKTWYMENRLLSNTIVFKMRPESPEIQEFRSIKIHSELDGIDHEYTHHAVEIFKEHGKYKVFDVLHRDKTLWLEDYLDGVCNTNGCPRERLRYDVGYLAPCHVCAGNMQELSDLMRYLDKQYKVGKPRFNVVNVPGEDESCLLSDDIIMDFDEFGRHLGVSGEDVIMAYRRVYDRLVGLRFNILHILCLGHIMRDPIMSAALAEGILDDEKICEMMDSYCH